VPWHFSLLYLYSPPLSKMDVQGGKRKQSLTKGKGTGKGDRDFVLPSLPLFLSGRGAAGEEGGGKREAAAAAVLAPPPFPFLSSRQGEKKGSPSSRGDPGPGSGVVADCPPFPPPSPPPNPVMAADEEGTREGETIPGCFLLCSRGDRRKIAGRKDDGGGSHGPGVFFLLSPPGALGEYARKKKSLRKE